jgi:phage repressor protein C with HTH and peptisase S24 domain
MDKRSERLRWAREQAGFIKAADAVERFGWAASTYYGHENGDRAFKEDAAKKYAAAFGVPWLWLIGHTDDRTPAQPAVASDKPAVPASNVTGGREPVEFDGRFLLPVRGRAVGGIDGLMIMDAEPSDLVLCPPKLIGVADAYAVYVSGDSMEPRYFADEVVYVHPRRPVSRNCFVVVELHTDEQNTSHAYVKQYVAQSATHLIVRQLNPPKEIEFARNLVKNCHRIVGSGEP